MIVKAGFFRDHQCEINFRNSTCRIARNDRHPCLMTSRNSAVVIMENMLDRAFSFCQKIKSGIGADSKQADDFTNTHPIS